MWHVGSIAAVSCGNKDDKRRVSERNKKIKKEREKEGGTKIEVVRMERIDGTSGRD